MHTHVIVDGSNIATEGRSKPSLAQLNDAVTTFMAEHPDITVTVVVDATFGHRIDKKERVEFDEAIANNELVAPPAGAIGRGDAFVLGVADKVGAAVLSNDSYQEFHGKYEWLFTEGRLIGGKPVPNVGWVFVERLPVRGPVSRRATAAGGKVVSKSPRKAAASTARTPSLSASGPPPVPKAPPPGAVAPAPRHSNGLSAFAAFRDAHPPGTTVKGIVEAYASHGATVRVGEVTCYVPLRLLSDPAPRSARDHLRIGETVTLMVAGYRPDRRSIDVGLPAVVKAVLKSAPATDQVASAVASPPVKPTPVRKAAVRPATSVSPVRKAAGRKSVASEKSAAAKKPVATTKTVATKKSPAAKKAAAARKPPAAKKPAAAKKPVPAKKAAAVKKSVPAKKVAAAKKGATGAVAKKRTGR